MFSTRGSYRLTKRKCTFTITNVSFFTSVSYLAAYTTFQVVHLPYRWKMEGKSLNNGFHRLSQNQLASCK
jgi:hypothetical protein